MAEAFNFKAAVQELVGPNSEVGKEEIAIWGGELKAVDGKTLEQVLAQFLDAWDLPNRRMRYCIWEYTHRIEFNTHTLPGEAEHHLLERGRVFGEGGDLSLRRDGQRFLWHFVGDGKNAKPNGVEISDFWNDSSELKANHDFKLRPYDQTAMLWGEYRDDLGRWQDDRVGWAKLSYPVSGAEAKKKGKRLRLYYTVFTNAGHVAFVWWKELK
jgi:hypothetical protein